MRCQKCNGLMLPERAVDGTFTLMCLRCLNCGRFVFPELEKQVIDTPVEDE